MGSVYLKTLALLVAIAASSPVSSALAPVQVDPINYDDPNMQMTGSYVAEASSSCIRQSGQDGAPVTDCMKGFKQSAQIEAQAPTDTKKKVR